MRLIDVDAIRLPKGFFEEVDNVLKFYEWLSEQPTIDPVPQLKWERDTAIEQLRQLGYGLGEKVKRGRWVKLDMHPHLADHKCTACGESAYVPTCMGEPMYLFCPNCGALMREDGEENG